MLFDPLSPEVVYALKGNIKAPNPTGVLSGAGLTTLQTSIQTLAQNRLNDAIAKPLALSGETQPAVTININSIPVADITTPVS